MPFSFCFLGPQAITHFHGSEFLFCSYNTTFAVLFLTSNMLVNKHSDFLALGFLNGVDVIGTLVLSYFTPSGVDTIEASRIYLRFFLVVTIILMLMYLFNVVQTFVFKIRHVA